jgi:N-acetylglucosaminyldiphosphoundecaprenol N-acetyl-beta-D-mannosaminyltransferase
MSTKVYLFGIAIDAVDRHGAACRIGAWLDDRPKVARIVVTPNTDHVVQYQHDESFRAAYNSASLVVTDGMPLVWASRLLGAPLPGRVNGCDLVEEVLSRTGFSERPRGLSVFLLGAPPGVAQRAGEQIVKRWKTVTVVGAYGPPMGFENSPSELARIIERINAVSPDLVVVGLGAPKQEIWAAAHACVIRAKVIICAGASINYIAGARRRAPRWMQNTGLEWVYRLVSEPRRLGPRYMVDLLNFPPLLLKEWAKHRHSLPGQRA